MTDPQDRDEERQLFDELTARIEANARNPRPCRPWLGVVRPGPEPGSWEVTAADRTPASPAQQARAARFPQQQSCASRPPEHALVRAVMAEVLTRLPEVDLPEHVRERSAVVARAALDEAGQDQPRRSKVLRLRDRLVDLLCSGLAERPGQAAQEVLGVVRQLY